MKIQPWKTVEIFKELSVQLKREVPLHPLNIKIAQATGFYEEKLRELWENFKKDPTRKKALELARFMVKYSAEIWRESALTILDVDELSQEQEDLLKEKMDEHHGFINKSLLPDLLKSIAAGTTDFGSFDYRVIFLYAGALWAFGSLLSITFDGLEPRDAADLFIFAGPNDENTCEGDRGCKQHVGKTYTVSEIVIGQILPGSMKCLTSCRHMLIPIASPLNEAEKSLQVRTKEKDVFIERLEDWVWEQKTLLEQWKQETIRQFKDTPIIVNVSPPEITIHPTFNVEAPKVSIQPATINIPTIEIPEIKFSPIINVPEIKVPQISIPETVINLPEMVVNIPDQLAPIVNIPAPVINLTNEIPTPVINLEIPVPVVNIPAPVVNVTNEVPEINISVPEIKIPEQVVNVTTPEVTVNIPKQPDPVVVVNVPAIEEEIIDIERDYSGLITRAKKTKRRGK